MVVSFCWVNKTGNIKDRKIINPAYKYVIERIIRGQKCVEPLFSKEIQLANFGVANEKEGTSLKILWLNGFDRPATLLAALERESSPVRL